MMDTQNIIRKIWTKILTCLGLLTCCACTSNQVSNGETVSHATGDRVALAYTEKFEQLQKRLTQLNIEAKQLQIFLRAIKEEELLEVWGKNKQDQTFQLIKTYPFCANSGTLGPKRKEGDRQIPEGIYYIDRFNPKSSFYLSLGINYPNSSDRILGDANAPGSDIFIHGACASVGCISITDDKIKEVYTLADQAFQNGQQQIPVHLFPMRLTYDRLASLSLSKNRWQHHQNFWKELGEIYQYFEQHKTLPKVSINEHSGAYFVQ